MRGSGLVNVVLLVVGIASVGVGQQYQRQEEQKQINPTVVKRWGTKFGTEMWKSLGKATRRDILAKDYNSNSNIKITEEDGYKMVTGMAAEIQIMMQHKIDAIKRIMELAENIALDHKYDKYRGKDLKDGSYHYINAKKLNVLPDGAESGKNIQEEFPKYLAAYRDGNDEYHEIGHSRMYLTANKHFSGIPVNTSHSSVHVPTNVYDGEPKVINAIDWSKKLDDTFQDNYKRDPSLSWQYFGSSTGFMRQYPAMKWLLDENDPDLYDARMRDWYIKSAASPKDIIILLDTSGSMTGLRKEIAKHVVLNILETLGEDDFVTVLTFSKYTSPLVKCFTNADGEPELVQATNENLAEFSDAVEEIETSDIANFTSALIQAFTILRDYSTQKDKGTNCNQAIMLVTDGVPYKEEPVFQKYNPKKEFNEPHKPVRMFTYLIGREISDLEAAKWMACENKGYFTHVTTLAEVKEQVLKYVPVMARPMVLLRSEHPVRWTGVYADVEVPNDRSLWVLHFKEPHTRREIREAQGKEQGFRGYKLMTSVSIPVYDKKNHTSLDVLGLKPDPQQNPFGKVRIAELLGVAGTDVPIEEIEKLTPPYKLGVNGYSFAVNNNGYILYHPDLRPMFKEILKPNYNSVDLTEVELVDNDNAETPRHNDSDLYTMRKHMVEQNDGQSFLKVKVHFDEMKRATIREQDYFFHKITNTPFTLGIVFPHKYGKYRVSGGTEINELRQNAPSPATYLDGKNWKLHPNWVYCEYNYAGQNHRQFDSPENNMRHFLEEMAKANGRFNWGKSRVRPLPKCKDNGKNPYNPECAKSTNKRDVVGEPEVEEATDEVEDVEDNVNVTDSVGEEKGPSKPNIDQASKGSFHCDKELVQMLVLDAQITKVFTEKNSRRDISEKNETESEPSINESDSEVETESPPTERPLTAEEEALEARKKLFELFGINLSFVATRSGLTRWEEHDENAEDDVDPSMEEEDRWHPGDEPKEPKFPDINNKATDEVWYKRAVEYHYNNPESFVFSVPFDVGDRRPTVVTATHAIFRGTGQKRAAAAVVGVLLDYDKFKNKFFSATVPMKGQDEEVSCKSESFECYVLDNNGFVIISEDKLNIGKFFGQIDGTILNSLVQNHVFKKIKIFDYQAICLEVLKDGSPASIMLTPFKLLFWLLNWVFGQMAWLAIRFEVRSLWNPDWTYASPYPQPQEPLYDQESNVYTDYEPDTYPASEYEEEDDYGAQVENIPVGGVYEDNPDDTKAEKDFLMKNGGPMPLLEMTYINKTSPKPCDKETYLYELNETKLMENRRPIQGVLRNCHESNCQRPFTVTMIPHTNLILVVTDTECPCFSAKLSVEPTKVDYGPANETEYCKKLKYNIYMKRPHQCVNYHTQEEEISLCGGGSSLAVSISLLLAVAIYHAL